MAVSIIWSLPRRVCGSVIVAFPDHIHCFMHWGGLLSVILAFPGHTYFFFALVWSVICNWDISWSNLLSFCIGLVCGL